LQRQREMSGGRLPSIIACFDVSSFLTPSLLPTEDGSGGLRPPGVEGARTQCRCAAHPYGLAVLKAGGLFYMQRAILGQPFPQPLRSNAKQHSQTRAGLLTLGCSLLTLVPAPFTVPTHLYPAG